MQMYKKPAKYFAVIACLLAVTILASCYTSTQDPNTGDNTPPVEDDSTASPRDFLPAPPTETPSTPPPPPPPVELVPYSGVVEHIFFHEAIAWPELAFDGGSGQRGYDDNMVTVSEYKKILESLHRNNYILVDLNDIWSEFVNDSGNTRMRRNTLMIPEGKLPIVISFDDLSFYEYMRGDGFMERYIIGDDGEIWAEGVDPNGNRIVSQDLTVVTILDKFVRENPDFSLGGAKGCIALTGYQGILGYRTQIDRDNDTPEQRLIRMQEVARVRPVVQRLKETGWYFATHSYGHIRIASASLNRVTTDAERWMEEVGSLVGETKIFIYPFGERLDGRDQDRSSSGPAFEFYHSLGFRIFASVGREPFTLIKSNISAVILDRMNSDGITLRNARERFLRLYDARDVFDPLRPSEYEVKW